MCSSDLVVACTLQDEGMVAVGIVAVAAAQALVDQHRQSELPAEVQGDIECGIVVIAQGVVRPEQDPAPGRSDGPGIQWPAALRQPSGKGVQEGFGCHPDMLSCRA